MTPNDYQALAMRTKADPVKILARLNELGPAYLQAMIASNGGTNEQGEIADILKATIEYGKGPVDPVHLTEEIGDALWRLSQLADAFGINLEACMRANIEKLKKRYPDTFSDYLANNRNLESEREALESIRPTPKPTGTGHAFANALEVMKERATPHGSPADEAFSMLFEPNRPGAIRSQKERVVVECHEVGSIESLFPSVNGAGFLEPPEEPEVQYPLDDEGVIDDKRWTFGQPTEAGDYEWFSPKHSMDPSKITLFKGFSGTPGTWGRDVYWRKAAYNYPGWTLGIPVEAGRYEWFYVQTPFDYKISLIEVANYSFTLREVYFRKLS